MAASGLSNTAVPRRATAGIMGAQDCASIFVGPPELAAFDEDPVAQASVAVRDRAQSAFILADLRQRQVGSAYGRTPALFRLAFADSDPPLAGCSPPRSAR